MDKGDAGGGTVDSAQLMEAEMVGMANTIVASFFFLPLGFLSTIAKGSSFMNEVIADAGLNMEVASV